MVPLQALQYNEENPHVQDSVKMTIQDWNVVNRRYVTLSLFIDLSVHTFSQLGGVMVTFSPPKQQTGVRFPAVTGRPVT